MIYLQNYTSMLYIDPSERVVIGSEDENQLLCILRRNISHVRQTSYK